MNEYLTFRRMITPTFIQVIFWIAAVAVVLGGIAALANGTAVGILIIILGPLGIRIYAELLMVVFRIHDDVAAIRRRNEAPETTTPGIAS